MSGSVEFELELFSNIKTTTLKPMYILHQGKRTKPKKPVNKHKQNNNNNKKKKTALERECSRRLEGGQEGCGITRPASG